MRRVPKKIRKSFVFFFCIEFFFSQTAFSQNTNKTSSTAGPSAQELQNYAQKYKEQSRQLKSSFDKQKQFIQAALSYLDQTSTTGGQKYFSDAQIKELKQNAYLQLLGAIQSSTEDHFFDYSSSKNIVENTSRYFQSTNNSIPKTPSFYSNQEVIANEQNLNELNKMLTENPNVQNALWQISQQRFNFAANNSKLANYYEKMAAPQTQDPLPPARISCEPNGYICSAISPFLNWDFSTSVLKDKEINFGVPLDEQAQNYINEGYRLAFPMGVLQKAFKGAKVKILPSFGRVPGPIEYTTFTVMNFALMSRVAMHLAPLYGITLDAGLRDNIIVLGLAASSTIPFIYAVSSASTNRAPSPFEASLNDETAKSIGEAIAENSDLPPAQKNKSIYKRFNDILTKNNFLARSVRKLFKSESAPKVASTEGDKKNPSNRELENKKMFPMPDPNSNNPGLPPPTADVPPIADAPPVDDPGGLNLPPGVEIDPSNGNSSTNPKEKIPQDPIDPTKDGQGTARGLQLLDKGIDMAVNGAVTTFNYWAYSYFVNAIFKAAYNRKQQIQSERFRTLISGSNKLNFLKLMALSLRPGQLTVPTVNTPSPAPTKPGSTPQNPTNPSAHTTKTTSDEFSFKKVLNNIISPKKPELKFEDELTGGDQRLFISNLAQSLHICSAHEVENANLIGKFIKANKVEQTQNFSNSETQAIAQVNKLMHEHPELVGWLKSKNPVNTKNPSAIREMGTDLLENITSATGQAFGIQIKPDDMAGSLFKLYAQNKISEDQIRIILLMHNCYKRPDSWVYNSLQEELISFNALSDASLAELRVEDAHIRLRMAELIYQFIYLNGEPLDDQKEYFQKVLNILNLDPATYNPYFHFYSATLSQNLFTPYVLSPTGYTLRTRKSIYKSGLSRNYLSALEPYDSSILDSFRPDEPAALNPYLRPAPPSGSNSGGSLGFDGALGF